MIIPQAVDATHVASASLTPLAFGDLLCLTYDERQQRAAAAEGLQTHSHHRSAGL